MMKCPFYKRDKDKFFCTLFGIEVVQHLDCKKCIENGEARNRAWRVEEHHIRERFFALIPKKYEEKTVCPHLGDKLEGVMATVKCCGGKTREVPEYECNKYNVPVTEKECLECKAGRPPSS